MCQKYSGLFRRPRGMYFSSEDRGEMMSMVYNWPSDQVCSTSGYLIHWEFFIFWHEFILLNCHYQYFVNLEISGPNSVIMKLQ